MPRLTDSDISRLLGGLGQPQPQHAAESIMEEEPQTLVSEPPPAQGHGDLDEIAQLGAGVAEAVRDGSLVSALEAALREYFGTAPHCSIADEAQPLVDPLRFEGGDPLEWHLDIGGPAAAALGDLVVGGDGTNVRHVKRRLLGRLLEPFATRVIATIAPLAHGAQAPMRFIETPRRSATPLVSGAIGAGLTSGGWIVGASLRSLRRPAAPTQITATAEVEPAMAPPAAESLPPAHSVVHPVSAPAEHAARAPGAAPSRERVFTPRAVETNGAFSGAVGAACLRLGEIARCATAPRSIAVTRVETPSLSRDDLKLALIAGGQGSLVLSASPAAMSSVAAATVGVDTPGDGKPGAVVVDAVEAVLRAALRAFAENLPGVAGSPLRFVRLAEGALPARSPHYSVVVPLRIGEREATLQWLVPTWMAATSQERGPSDGR